MSNENNSIILKTVEWVKTIRRNKIIAALLFLIQGIVFIARPEAGMLKLARWVAAFVVLGALADVVGYFLAKDKTLLSTCMMVGGVVLVIAGIYLYVRPEILAGVLRYLIAIVAVVIGLSNIVQTLRVKKKMDARAIVGLVINILTIGLGLSLFLQPVAASAMITQMIGGVMIINAVSELWGVFYLSSVIKAAK